MADFAQMHIGSLSGTIPGEALCISNQTHGNYISCRVFDGSLSGHSLPQIINGPGVLHIT